MHSAILILFFIPHALSRAPQIMIFISLTNLKASFKQVFHAPVMLDCGLDLVFLLHDIKK